MSYEIVYDKQFIKLKDNLFVPMLYWGSNNCYENNHGGRERRARDWSVWTYIAGNKHYATKEEILANCEKLRQSKVEQYNKDDNDPDIDDSFGYWSSIAIGGSTRNTTYGKFKGLFNTGCRKALTIEQLKEEGISVNIRSYLYNGNYEELGVEEFNGFPKNGEEFIEMIDYTEKQYKSKGISVFVSLNGASETNMKYLRRKYFPRKRKTVSDAIEVDKFYTITVDGHYFARKTKWGYKYTYYPYVKYATEKEALRRIKNYDDKYKVELVEEKATIY